MKYLLTLLLLLFLADALHATNLRGQITRFNPATGTYTPLKGVRVDLWIYNGTQLIKRTFAVTAKDGSYLFVNINPGYRFHVQVLGKFYPARPLTVKAIEPPKFQTIPSITT